MNITADVACSGVMSGTPKGPSGVLMEKVYLSM
jgi:hypothetical protein